MIGQEALGGNSEIFIDIFTLQGLPIYSRFRMDLESLMEVGLDSKTAHRSGVLVAIMAYGFVLFAIYGASAFLVEMYSGFGMFGIPKYLPCM